mgnify:CR=1 FL=1
MIFLPIYDKIIHCYEIKKEQKEYKKKGKTEMPINIPNNLPAFSTLVNEKIFVMSDEKAAKQDIRPLKVAIVNLMPTKIVTETQFARLLGNTPLQVELELLQTATHKSTHTSEDHMLAFYKTFDEVEHKNYDGMIITGASGIGKTHLAAAIANKLVEDGKIVLMGRLSRLMPIEEEKWIEAIKQTVAPKFAEVNLKAFGLGRRM